MIKIDYPNWTNIGENIKYMKKFDLRYSMGIIAIHLLKSLLIIHRETFQIYRTWKSLNLNLSTKINTCPVIML